MDYPELLILLLSVVALLVYLIPTGVAAYRLHHQLWAILALNLLLGWTVIGWALALVWAFTAVRGATPTQAAN